MLVYPDQKRVDFVRLGRKGQHAMMRGEKGFHQFAIKACSAATGPLFLTLSVKIPAIAGVRPH
jgi:hypothetical protein